MQKSQQQVKEFHEKFDLVINETPTILDEATLKLRCKLLLEEVLEFIEAAGFGVMIDLSGQFTVARAFWGAGLMDPITPNLVEMADALADIQYVNDGAAISLGIDLEPLATEVHRSNMSKLWKMEEINQLRLDTNQGYNAKGDVMNGFVVKDEHQKVIKSPSYSPADIKSELVKQGAKL